MQDVESFLNTLIKNSVGLERDIKLEDRLKEDLNLDSLAILTIADEVEEKFSIFLDADDLSVTPKTVKELVSLINSKRS